MKNRTLCFLLLALNFTMPTFALDGIPWFGEKDPNSFLKKDNSPRLDMKIVDEENNSISLEVMEDLPITLIANSEIFEPEAPIGMGNSYEYFDQPEWIEEKAKTFWFVNDLDRDISYMATSSTDLPQNKIIVVPNNPTENCKIACYSSRNMKYLREDGRTKIGTAKSEAVVNFRVKDITPPNCGFEISVVKGGNCFCSINEDGLVENTLQKKANINFSGSLFNVPEGTKTAQGYILGDYMLINEDDGSIYLTKSDVIKIKILEHDNYAINPESIKYGICAGAGGEATAISNLNQPEIDLSELSLPENPYFFLEASDLEGNVQKLFVPLSIQ